MPIRGQTFTLQPSATQNASGFSTVQIPVDMFTELDLFVNVTGLTGTSPTVTVFLQSSPDGGTTWANVPGATTAALSANGEVEISSVQGIGDLVRVGWTLGGSGSPTATFAVTAEGK